MSVCIHTCSWNAESFMGVFRSMCRFKYSLCLEKGQKVSKNSLKFVKDPQFSILKPESRRCWSLASQNDQTAQLISLQSIFQLPQIYFNLVADWSCFYAPVLRKVFIWAEFLYFYIFMKVFLAVLSHAEVETKPDGRIRAQNVECWNLMTKDSVLCS